MSKSIPQPRLSVSLALQALSEAANEVERLESALAEARAARDDLLIGLAGDPQGGVPITRLAKLANISRERASRIAAPHMKGQQRD